MSGPLHEEQYTFMIISRSVLIIKRNISDRNCRGNQNAFYVLFLNLAVYEIIWKNVLQPGMLQMTVWLMYILCFEVVQPVRPRPTALLSPRSYGKPEAATAVNRLLMMGIRMSETC
jgi:hypothetical protein